MCKYYEAFRYIAHIMNIAKQYDSTCNPITDIEDITSIIIGSTLSYTPGDIIGLEAVHMTIVKSIENETAVECLTHFQINENELYMNRAACILRALEHISESNFEETMYYLGKVVATSYDPTQCNEYISATEGFKRFRAAIHNKWPLLHEWTRHKSDSSLVVRQNMYDDFISHDVDKINGMRVFTSHACLSDQFNVSIDLLHFTPTFIRTHGFLDKRIQEVNMSHALTDGMLYIENYKNTTIFHNPYTAQIVQEPQIDRIPLQSAFAVSTVLSMTLLSLMLIKYGTKIPGISYIIETVNDAANYVRVRLREPFAPMFRRFRNVEVVTHETQTDIHGDEPIEDVIVRVEQTNTI